MSEPLSPSPMIQYSDLRQKEVINICTCRTLGCVSDLVLDSKNGSILSLIVPGGGRMNWFFGKECEYIIPWYKIVRIGADIILVEVDEETVRKTPD